MIFLAITSQRNPNLVPDVLQAPLAIVDLQPLPLPDRVNIKISGAQGFCITQVTGIEFSW